MQSPLSRIGPLLVVLLGTAACGGTAPPTPPEPTVEPPPRAPLIDSHAIARHTCMLDTAGVARCWGSNRQGQLGDGTLHERAAPVPVAGGAIWQQLSVGGHTCGLDASGVAFCWGRNEEGQLGDGTTRSHAAPAAVGPLPPLIGETQASAAPGLVSIAAGGAHTCALTERGIAYCWGDNRFGQLGDGTTSDRPSPVQVATERPLAAISTGDRHTCALARDGETLCWGDDSLGQLGRVSAVGIDVRPRIVEGLPPLVQISAGHGHSCGHTEDGQLWCWGHNGIGQLGTGAPPASFSPVQLDSLPPIAGVVVGYHHTCARDRNGSIHCWGSNVGSSPHGSGFDGQLGVEVSWTNVPLVLPAPTHAADLAAGDAHTCALLAHGAIMCWGSNADAQLGTEGRGGPTPRALDVSGSASRIF